MKIYRIYLALLILPVPFFAPLLCKAKFLENPDANTLWIEDGVDMELGPKAAKDHWNIDGMDISPATGGGIVFDSPGGGRNSTCRYVPINADYPYLVWEITDIQRKTGYSAFSMGWRVVKAYLSLGMTTTELPKGIFAYSPITTNPRFPPNNQPQLLQMYLYGAAITMKCIKVVKKPEYFIEMSSPAFIDKQRLDLGDFITFKVIMAKPAEDVTLTFFDRSMQQLAINGETRWQLKPVNKNPSVWSVSQTIKSCTGDTLKPGEQFKFGDFLIKATILGGDINVPLWTCNQYEFRLKPKTGP